MDGKPDKKPQTSEEISAETAADIEQLRRERELMETFALAALEVDTPAERTEVIRKAVDFLGCSDERRRFFVDIAACCEKKHGAAVQVGQALRDSIECRKMGYVRNSYYQSLTADRRLAAERGLRAGMIKSLRENNTF